MRLDDRTGSYVLWNYHDYCWWFYAVGKPSDLWQLAERVDPEHNRQWRMTKGINETGNHGAR